MIIRGNHRTEKANKWQLEKDPQLIKVGSKINSQFYCKKMNKTHLYSMLGIRGQRLGLLSLMANIKYVYEAQHYCGLKPIVLVT